MNNLGENIFKVAVSRDVFKAYAIIPRKKQNKVYDFIEKFEKNPMSPGINYEKIVNASDPNMRSVRIDDAYRGIVLKPEKGNVYILLWVAHHDDAYEWAKRKKCNINPNTGTIQVYTVNEEVSYIKQEVVEEKEYLFSKISDEQLKKIGVPDEQMYYVKNIENVEQLDAIKESLPEDSRNSLDMYLKGASLEDIMELIVGFHDEEIDVDDFESALRRNKTRETFCYLEDEESEKELYSMLEAPLESWRVFLHSSQRKIKEREFNGPARILGGAGTGKTVVAMHRAKYLAKNVFNNPDDRILFTTFTKNLVEDIRDNMKSICKSGEMNRIEFINLDKWIIGFLRKNNYRYNVVYGEKIDKLWEQALAECASETNETDLTINFFKDEWHNVIKPQGIKSLREYIKAVRVGRGVKLNRGTKKSVWEIVEKFIGLMETKGIRDIDTAMEDAGKIIDQNSGFKAYKAVIVDEAQDFNEQAYRLIRKMAGKEHKNDIFIAGDAHQRIYGKKVVMKNCDINIRGRSSILKINYRTTEETKNWAVKILKNVEVDDLDGGVDSGKGYVSLMHGPVPMVENFANFNEESEFILNYIKSLNTKEFENSRICLVARTKSQLNRYKEVFKKKNIRVFEIKTDEKDERDFSGIRITTMHRVKGLEFDYVIIAGVNDDLLPNRAALRNANDEVAKTEVENKERSVLYVAATRAKKEILVTSYGKKSRFI